MRNSSIQSVGRFYRDLPQLVRFVLQHSLVGALYGAATAGAFLLADAFGLGELVSTSSQPLIPALMLFVGFGTTIGSAYVGAVIMLLPYDSTE
jgi:hypothetical protein